jgi:hypothetical protein
MEDNYEEEMHYHFVIQNTLDVASRYGIDVVLQDIIDAWNFRLKQQDCTIDIGYEYS